MLKIGLKTGFKTLIASLLLLTLSNTLTFAQTSSVLHGYVGYQEIIKPSFTKQDLDQIVKTQNPHSIAELLTVLPTVLKRNVIVMFKSRSLQESSYSNPRILLFNEDASLVLTFNGHPSQAGYEALEVMFFDFNILKFKFYEIIFDQDLKKRLQFDQQANNRINRQGINPPTCLACHRSPQPRPNWGTYNIWPGAIGQSDHGVVRLIKDIHSPGYVVNQEWIALKSFLENSKTNPRYSKLSVDYDFLLKKINEVDKKNSLIEKSIFFSTSKYETIFDKPSYFTTQIASLNFLRLGNDIICSPNYSENKNAIRLALSSEVNKKENLEELSLLLGLDQKSVMEEAEKIMTLQEQSGQLFRSQNNELSKGNNFEYDNDALGKNLNVALLAIVLEHKLNIDLSNYELSFEKGNYNFSTPDASLNRLWSMIDHLEVKVGCKVEN